MRRVILAFLGLLLLAALVGGWYVYDKGFTRRWRLQVSEEFRKRGVEVSLKRLTVDPFRGLLAREVKVFDARDRRRVIAVIDEILLGVNYAALLRGENFLEALDLRDANLSLPVDPTKPQGARIEISKLNARLFLPPQQIYLARAEAEVLGIQVSAAGRLINPQVFLQRQKSASAPPGAVATKIVEEIKALNFANTPPVISLTFTGDLADPAKLVIDLSVWAEQMRRESYVLRNLYLVASYRDGLVDIKQLTAADRVGTLRFSGSYHPETRRATVQLRSGLDFQSFASALHLAPQLGEFVFYGSPALELTGSATLSENPKFEALGHLALQKFAYRSVVFDALDGDFSWDGVRWSARNLHLAHRTGEVRGDVLQVPGETRARLKSTIDPKTFQPFVSGPALIAMREFEFADSPVVSLEARGSALSRDALTVSGELKLGATTYRGVPAQSAEATFHYEDRVLTISPFHLQRSDGGGGGGLTFNFKTNEVQLDKIRGAANPVDIITWIEPKLIEDVAPYRFRTRAPNVVVDGLVHTKGGKTTRLTIDVDSPAGMDYTFLKKELRSPRLSGRLFFTSDKLRILHLNASLFGGRLLGDAEISLARDRPGHSVNLQVENVDFASVTKLYFNYDDSKGRLTGRYDFTGRGDDARTMSGAGELAVTEGNVFAIPFLGPLSFVLNTIVPGMGYNVAHKATTTFTIREGVIATDDLEVQGQGFSMYGSGKLFFLDDKMDFDMRINARGLPGVLLFPVSKLFEYTSDAKLSKPTWRSKVVPRF